MASLLTLYPYRKDNHAMSLNIVQVSGTIEGDCGLKEGEGRGGRVNTKTLGIE